MKYFYHLVTKCLYVGIFLGINARITQAQEYTPLSLADAISIGLENNFDIRIADYQANIATNNNAVGEAGMLPRVDLNLGGSGFYTGSPASFITSRLNANTGATISWTLFDGFRAQATKERLELLEADSEGNAAIIVETTIQAIILGYYNALLAQEQENVLMEVLAASARRYDYEELRKEMGASGTFELLQFKDAFFTDSANLVIQKLNLRNEIRNLNLLMNVPVESEWELTDDLQERFSRYEFEDLRDKMLEDNNNLKNQYIANNILRQDTRIAEADMYPTISLNTGVTYGSGTANRADGQSVTFSAFDYTAGISIGFNLFNGGQVRRAIQNARINEQIGLLSERQLKESLVNDLLVTLDTYSARREVKELRDILVENAALNLDIAEDRFESGLINSLDYRQIQLQFLNAQLSRLEALRDLKESETELVRLTGGLVREN